MTSVFIRKLEAQRLRIIKEASGSKALDFLTYEVPALLEDANKSQAAVKAAGIGREINWE